MAFEISLAADEPSTVTVRSVFGLPLLSTAVESSRTCVPQLTQKRGLMVVGAYPKLKVRYHHQYFRDRVLCS